MLKSFCAGGVAQLARACGSYPQSRGFESHRRHQRWVRSSVGERFLDEEEVAGSIPAAPTRGAEKAPFFIQDRSDW
ncbi:MAG: hypothetical protein PWP09_679 [Thermotogota bacterium]|nr:hypothetical protein [Thermotogota bacterium]